MPRKIIEASADAATQAVETAEELKASSTVLEEAAETVENVYEASAEAVQGVPAAIREGASDARRAVAGILPAMGTMVRKSVYGGFYYGSYGVVFGALVVSRLIPSNNAIGEGIRDGAVAARADFDSHEHVVHSKPVEGL